MKKYITIVILLMSCLATFAQDSTARKKMSDKKHKLSGVTIKRKSNGNTMESGSFRLEKIGTKELKKNACCNLAESFESNASIELGSTSALSGAKQVEMLGLQGTYVQTLIELLPYVRGINYTYGFNNVPGPFVESIYINKGPGSVTNGFESMTGQIDVELVKPKEYKPLLHINGYLNNFARQELNLNTGVRLSEEVSTLFSAHYSQRTRKMDVNNDGFMDVPTTNMIHLMNRWKYDGKRFESMLLAKYHKSDEQAGQMSYNHDKNITEQNTTYGIEVQDQRMDVMHKMGYAITKDREKSIGLQSSFSSQNRNSFYGRSFYNGYQQTITSNLIYQSHVHLGEKEGEIRMGAGIVADKVREEFQLINQDRDEAVTGLFAEYTYTENPTYTVLIGARGDYNWRLNRAYFIPRINVSYNITEDFSARFSGGSGFRTPTVFAENTRFFASSRQVEILEPLLPEYSWNYGVNLNYDMYQAGKESRLSLDIFRTDFTDQVVVDYDASPQKVLMYNLDGQSRAWYVQAEWYYELFKNFDIRLAYKFNDVKNTQRGELVERAFNPRNRALVNLAYETSNDRWAFDLTTQWVGKQRLPDFNLNPEIYRPSVGTFAPDYIRMLGQFTYRTKDLELYVGSENLTGFRQNDLIIDAQNPFGNYFDAGAAWGPTTGQMAYVGFRYTLDREVEPVLSKNKVITEKIKVDGVCGMCKERIEEALDIKGVKFAEWDEFYKVLTVRYNKTVITNDAIQQAVAAVGHDTEKYKASDAVYNKLHGCCKYRDEEVIKDHE
jgi:outer membrane receptor for ferrienterochelin and colicins